MSPLQYIALLLCLLTLSVLLDHCSRGAELLPGMGIDLGAARPFAVAARPPPPARPLDATLRPPPVVPRPLATAARLDIWARLADFLGRMGGGVASEEGQISHWQRIV
jgi:hypothetical protein